MGEENWKERKDERRSWSCWWVCWRFCCSEHWKTWFHVSHKRLQQWHLLSCRLFCWASFLLVARRPWESLHQAFCCLVVPVYMADLIPSQWILRNTVVSHLCFTQRYCCIKTSRWENISLVEILVVIGVLFWIIQPFDEGKIWRWWLKYCCFYTYIKLL